MIRVITTVLTPATNFNLTTVANLRSDLDLSDTAVTDDYLDRLIKQCSRAIRGFCGREFAVQAYRDTLRNAPLSVAADNADRILLSNTPLVDVTSVSEDGTSLTEDNYDIDKDLGALYRLSAAAPSNWNRANLIVEYRAGWLMPGDSAAEDDDTPPPPLPADLEDACIRMAKGKFLARGRDPSLMSQDTPNVGSRRWWVGEGAIPPDIGGLLEPYVLPALA